MTPAFYPKFLSWVARHVPQVGPLNTEAGFSDWMVSPHVVTLRQDDLDQIRMVCQTIFDVTPSRSDVAKGIFSSVDFYITDQGPRVIEVNTNSAGAILVELITAYQTHQTAPSFEWIRNMVQNGLVAAGCAVTSTPVIAIVDESPDFQKTRFDFQMANALFRSFGWDSAIWDPGQLTWNGSELRDPVGREVQFVYNRYCDFLLESELATALRQFYSDRPMAISPNPGVYSQYADKSQLVRWSQRPELSTAIPKVKPLTDWSREDAWANRRQLFFKPMRSYGAKAVYKGDGISKRVFESLWESDYIAQPYFKAGQCMVDGEAFKYDIRAYVWEGQVTLIGARLFQGQVTNFKTPGGGFAAVQIEG